MNAVVERSEHSEVTLKVEVEPERLAQATDKAYQRLVQRVNIPGFRRGKAPRKILERTVGLDALYREALDFVMPAAYRDAVKESQIAPYAQPEFEVVQLEPDKPLIFKATVPVEPVVELGDYRTIQVQPEDMTVGDEEVEKALKNVQEANGQWVPVEDRAIRMGDQVNMDVITSIDGRVLSGDKPQDGMAELEAEAPYPRWANALAGLRIGDQKEIVDTLPEDYRNAELRGKDVTYQVTIKAIKQKDLPAIDDELARSVGDFDDLDALKADLRRRLELEKKRQAKTKFEHEVVTQLVERSKVEYPALMVDEKLDQMTREADVEFHRQGFNLETFLKATNKSYEEFRNDWRPQAIDRIKTQLTLRALAEKEGIDVTDDDIATEVRHIVEDATPDRRPQLEQSLASLRVRASIRDSLRSRKALDFLDQLAGGEMFAGELPGEHVVPQTSEGVAEEAAAIVE